MRRNVFVFYLFIHNYINVLTSLKARLLKVKQDPTKTKIKYFQIVKVGIYLNKYTILSLK